MQFMDVYGKYEDLEFVDTFNIIHPADDVEAKWKLQDLFKDSLG
ncbi:836_t:CDS:2 [Entrophospora sp. SA101]|nr:836_t:CDS:2 [Entrophospora sp. SA101]